MNTKQLALLFLTSISLSLFGAEENTNTPLITQFIQAVEKGPKNTEGVKRAKEIITCYLKHKKELLDHVYNGSTPLAWAALNGNYPVVEFLCKNDIPVNTRMRSHATALHEAAGHGCPKTITILLTYNSDVNAENAHRQTPLHRAIISDKTEAALMLIEADSPLNAADDCGNTALSLAGRKGMLTVTQSIYLKLGSSQL